MPSSLFLCLSLSLSLSYSFLCTWPWLFPHRCGFPSPPLWQLHINHFHIPRKTTFVAFLHSISFSPFHCACIFLSLFLSVTLSLHNVLTFSPHTLFLMSHQISIYVTCNNNSITFLAGVSSYHLWDMLPKGSALAAMAINLTYSKWILLWENHSGCSQQK